MKDYTKNRKRVQMVNERTRISSQSIYKYIPKILFLIFLLVPQKQNEYSSNKFLRKSR